MDYSKEENNKKTKSRKSKKTKIKNKLVTMVFRVTLIVLVIGLFSALSAGIGIYMGIIESAPSFENLLNYIQPDIYTSIIYEEKTGLEIDRLVGEENREYVSIDRIPLNLRNAIVAIEDARFYTHNGVDLKGFIRAAYITLTSDRSEGGSTITQQLIKNNVFRINRNTYKTKLQEQYLAINYEKYLISTLGSKQKAKDYILELYMNTIGLAHGVNGVQAAALRYFGKNVEELSLAECAVIAGITQNPSKYSPISNPENNKAHQKVILNNMLELGFISESERAAALEEDVYSNINEIATAKQQTATYHSYFVDQLIEEVVRDLMDRLNYSLTLANYTVYNGGLQIYATIDSDMQKIVDEAYSKDDLFPKTDYEISVTYFLTKKNQITGETTNHEKTGAVKKHEDIDALIYKFQGELLGQDDIIVAERVEPVVQPQSSFVIVDYYTGQVKALAGGRGEKLANRVLNRATHSPRQPGSVFKVLASFAPALDMGLITPATVYDDVPNYMPETGKVWPNNWYSNPRYRGLSTVREGIRDSMNVVTVKNFLYLGAENSFDYLINFGFEYLTNGKTINGEYRTDLVPSTALGGLTEGVTTLELAAAYGAIANNGEYIKPHFYTKVLSHDDEPILENNADKKRVLKETTSYLLTDMMKDVINAGTGTRAKFKDIKMPQAGKTGTTSDNIDLVFAGYTPYYSAAIWLGHDMPKTIKSTDYSHLQIWRYIMEEIHKDLPYKDFETPDGIVTVSVCRDSGLLPGELCGGDPRGGRVHSEKFEAGTQPTKYCNVHKSYVIDRESGMLANEYCPEENKTTAVGIVRPVPYSGSEYIRDRQYEISYGQYCNLHGPNAIVTEEPEPPEDSEDSEAPVVTETPNYSEHPDYSDYLELPVMDDPLTVDDPAIVDDEPVSTPNVTQDSFRHEQ